MIVRARRGRREREEIISVEYRSTGFIIGFEDPLLPQFIRPLRALRTYLVCDDRASITIEQPTKCPPHHLNRTQGCNPWKTAPEDTHSLLSSVRAVDKGAMHTTSPDRAPSSSSPASTALLVAATVALVVSLAGVVSYNFSDALYQVQVLKLVQGRQDLTAISIAASDGHPSSHPGAQRSMTPMIRDPPSV